MTNTSSVRAQKLLSDNCKHFTRAHLQQRELLTWEDVKHRVTREIRVSSLSHRNTARRMLTIKTNLRWWMLPWTYRWDRQIQNGLDAKTSQKSQGITQRLWLKVYLKNTGGMSGNLADLLGAFHVHRQQTFLCKCFNARQIQFCPKFKRKLLRNRESISR